MAVAKKASKADKDLSRMITPEFRVSYPHVFKAQAVKATDKPKFSITMLFPKDKKIIGSTVDGVERSLVEVMKNAKIAAFGSQENWPVDADGNSTLESPVTDGDDPKHKDKEGYKGHWVIRAATSEEQRPTVVGEDMTPITDPADFYPGCYARAYIYAYKWEYMNREGIGFILDHVQKLRDGKSFGGKKPVEQVFSPVQATAGTVEDEENFL